MYLGDVANSVRPLSHATPHTQNTPYKGFAPKEQKAMATSKSCAILTTMS
jgi:hypothetical protein